jgi:hypothetical protein
MATSIQNHTHTIGIAPLLGTAFIVLKLCGVIAWSWWWVLAPFWIPLVIVAGVLGVVAILALIAFLCNK